MNDLVAKLPLAATGWHVYRIIPSRFPAVSIFDRISEAVELDVFFEVEAMTNDRLREEAGDISLVPVEDRVVGPGSTPIMAAFTHLNAEGARYTDSTFGAYYAATDLDTAVAETVWHRSRMLADIDAPPTEIDQRVYVATLTGDLHDVRPILPDHPELAMSDDYSAPQTLARTLRASGSNGVIYNSVRQPGGVCVAVYRARLLSNCVQERHLTYKWDGNTISGVYEKANYKKLDT